MTTVTTNEGTAISYKDWGAGAAMAVQFVHECLKHM